MGNYSRDKANVTRSINHYFQYPFQILCYIIKRIMKMIYKELCLRELKYEVSKNCMLIITILIIGIISVAINFISLKMAL